jgi:4-diphosphocytidyl-2-C-methyl-D-erythritol kinase
MSTAQASAWWPAPAKLNLMLRVVGRREDGYHLLQTVFQLLDYGDQIQFQVNDTGRIRLMTPQAGVAPEDDLTLRAARLLQQSTGCAGGVDIRLDKRIPMGGGLGGGSSDAATSLLALNWLWGLGLEEGELAALGLRLGADVPVFVRGESAWAEGVGERLQSLDLPCPWYLVLRPACHVSTAAVFGAPDLTRNAPPITITDFMDGAQENAFAHLVRRGYPVVDQAFRWLGRYAEPRLTGTGACVFAAFSDEAEAMEVLLAAQGQFQGFVARGLNRSPLRAMLEAG